MGGDPRGDHVLLTMIDEASRDDTNSDQRQRKRKQKGILEHHIGKMPEIHANPDCAEYRVDPARQNDGDQQQSDIEDVTHSPAQPGIRSGRPGP